MRPAPRLKIKMGRRQIQQCSRRFVYILSHSSNAQSWHPTNDQDPGEACTTHVHQIVQLTSHSVVCHFTERRKAI